MRAAVARDADPTVQLAAAVTLAELFDGASGPSCAPVIMRAIDRQIQGAHGEDKIYFDFYGQTRDVGLVIYALSLVGERGGAPVREYFLRALGDERAAVRAGATVGFYGRAWAAEPRAETALWRLLRQDPSREVRYRTAMTLNSRRTSADSPQPGSTLAEQEAASAAFFLRLLQAEPDANTRLAALDCLWHFQVTDQQLVQLEASAERETDPLVREPLQGKIALEHRRRADAAPAH